MRWTETKQQCPCGASNDVSLRSSLCQTCFLSRHAVSNDRVTSTDRGTRVSRVWVERFWPQWTDYIHTLPSVQPDWSCNSCIWIMSSPSAQRCSFHSGRRRRKTTQTKQYRVERRLAETLRNACPPPPPPHTHTHTRPAPSDLHHQPG